ncbi:NAD(P)H-binding protein [Antrihabitans cavernicola]|uniref:NAD-dependent epimerase/dehydratase family protein n=1 Tax=Antrihabitans cavernicola TaxID=2495913 RepID=A0A5A7SGJ2_9NOCA|nr:NAD(P)H-binding protein [Spelaeibacter cavernicola]KAA0024946.1 NAD-dependent epimerase/dehydratase family protein [Spelaeibacter cavernicola]
MTILVTGATGNIGRMVVDHLLTRGATDVRALTNNPSKAALPSGVEVVHGYLGKLDTLPAAFDGVDQLYLAPLLATADEAVQIAARAGVKHVVDVAGPPGNWWYPISEAIERTGVEWTHLWPGEFMENAAIWADQIRGGTVREPYPTAANAPTAMDDIAAMAAAVLVDDDHRGKAYRLTGPQSLTRRERVRQIAIALDRHIDFQTVSLGEGIEVLQPSMGDHAQWYLEGLASLVEHPEQPNTVFADVMGREPTSFADWIAKNVALFHPKT